MNQLMIYLIDSFTYLMHFLKKILIWISLNESLMVWFVFYFHGESETLDISASPTFVNHEEPLISEEELFIPFIPCPYPFQATFCTKIS